MKADQWSVMKAAPLSTLTTAAIATAIALIVVPLPGEHLTLQASIQDDETTGDYDYWLQVSKQTAGALTPGALRRQRRRSPLPRGSAGGGSDVAGGPLTPARHVPHTSEPTHAKRAPSAVARGREAARPVGDGSRPDAQNQPDPLHAQSTRSRAKAAGVLAGDRAPARPRQASDTTSSKRLQSEHPRQPARPAASAVGAAGPLLVRAAPPPSADAHLGESTTPRPRQHPPSDDASNREPRTDDTAEAPLARARQPTGAPLLISLSPRDVILRQHAQGEGDDAASREQPDVLHRATTASSHTMTTGDRRIKESFSVSRSPR